MPERHEQREASGDDGTLTVLHAMLTTFSDVLEGTDRRLSSIEAALRALQRDQDRAEDLKRALHNLDRVEPMEEDLREVRAALLDHPASTVYEAIVRLTAQIDGLVAQPGPGPAMAMVAAGLSERFERRTENLVVLLQGHAELMHALTDQVHEAMAGVVVTVEGRQAGLDALLDTVRAVAGTVQGLDARFEEARDRLDAVFQAGNGLPEVVRFLRELEGTLRETIEHDELDPGALGGLIRDQTELLGERMTAISGSLEEVARLLARHQEDTTHSLGRKASDVGRRLVSELGLAARTKDRATRPAQSRPAPADRPSEPEAEKP
ncbi:MAG TPA: hypothetical protein VMZ51_02880 [Acidimicrobiales bacterium]|nr:hypothetical protein [Acidimicrobiales bacterium]